MLIDRGRIEQGRSDQGRFDQVRVVYMGWVCGCTEAVQTEGRQAGFVQNCVDAALVAFRAGGQYVRQSRRHKEPHIFLHPLQKGLLDR